MYWDSVISKMAKIVSFSTSYWMRNVYRVNSYYTKRILIHYSYLEFLERLDFRVCQVSQFQADLEDLETSVTTQPSFLKYTICSKSEENLLNLIRYYFIYLIFYFIHDNIKKYVHICSYMACGKKGTKRFENPQR